MRVFGSEDVSTKKTVFFPVSDWGTVLGPNLDVDRSILWCAAGHWIAVVSLSCEIHTTRPILSHRGHFARSPTMTISCFPPSSYCRWTFSFQTFFFACRWCARMICIFCSFWRVPLLTYTFTFLPLGWVVFLKRFNYSVGSAQRIRETLRDRMGHDTYKGWGLETRFPEEHKAVRNSKVMAKEKNWTCKTLAVINVGPQGKLGPSSYVGMNQRSFLNRRQI